MVSISKSGFCYSATGTVGGRISLDVDPNTGKPSVRVQVDNPNIDVDIPWYCWVAGAVIGALLGGIFQSLIAVIIGAVLVPLIMFIAEQVIEGVVNTVAERIANALNNILQPIPLPAVGFKLILRTRPHRRRPDGGSDSTHRHRDRPGRRHGRRTQRLGIRS